MLTITFLLGLLCLLTSKQLLPFLYIDAWPDWTNVTAKWNFEWIHSDNGTRGDFKFESKRKMMKKSVEEVMILYKARLKEFKRKINGRIKV